jgi:hypothetical protein
MTSVSPFDVLQAASSPARDWLVSRRTDIALDVHLPGLNVIRVELETR